MKKIVFVLVLCLLLVGCGPKPEEIQATIVVAARETVEAIPTVTSYPTLTPYPTLKPYPTFTKAPTQTARVVVVTETSTPAPEVDPLYAPKMDGFYLIGQDIGVGIWRTEPGFDDCYWEMTFENGDIHENHFGLSGGTIPVTASAFQLQFHDCGTLTFLK